MKIAILSDVHGNIHGLEAVLADLENERPDRVVCAGDMTGCHFAGSVQVMERLQQAGVPMVMGNQEEFFLAYHDPAGNSELKTAVRLRPMHFFARQMPAETLVHLRALPMTLKIPGPGGQDVLVCHASPGHTRRSFADGVDEGMAQELERSGAAVIAAGHYHRRWHRYWQGRLLVLSSSAGLPLQGVPDEVEYLVLTHQNGAWGFYYRTVRYDAQAALDEMLRCGFLQGAGPMGRLILDEVVYQRDHLMPFLSEDREYPPPLDEAAWAAEIQAYLQKVGRWEAAAGYGT